MERNKITKTNRMQRLILATMDRKWAFGPGQELQYEAQIKDAFSRTRQEFEGLESLDIWRTLEDIHPGWHEETREICGTLSYMPNELLEFVKNLCENFITVRKEHNIPESGWYLDDTPQSL